MTALLSLSLFLTCHESDVIGFRAIPGILPAEVVRLPGESLRLMLERTRQAATGRGAYLLIPVVRSRGTA